MCKEKTDLLVWHYCLCIATSVPRTPPPDVKRPRSTVDHSDPCIRSRLKMSGTIPPFHNMSLWCVQRLHFYTVTMAVVFPKVPMNIAFPDCVITCPL